MSRHQPCRTINRILFPDTTEIDLHPNRQGQIWRAPIDPAQTHSVLQYPANNRYTDCLRAATILAIANPDSMYIAVGGGLG